MQHPCKCPEPKSAASTLPDVQTLNLEDVSALTTRNVKRMNAFRADQNDRCRSTHSLRGCIVTSDGGVFLTTSSVGNLQGDVTLTGTIGLLVVELHLTVKIDGDTAHRHS